MYADKKLVRNKERVGRGHLVHIYSRGSGSVKLGQTGQKT